MTDESNTISRRNVLAGLGAVGVGGALVGAGTSAYFSDGEKFSGNELVAGELELKLDWQQFYYGAPDDQRPQDYGTAGRPYVNAHPDHDKDGEQSIEVDGQTYRYDDLGRNIGDDEIDYCTDLDDDYYFGKKQDSLIDLQDIKPGDCGEITFSYHLCDNPGWLWLGAKNKSYETVLADEIEAVLWHDLDGDNELDDDEPIIVEGSLRDVLDALNQGILLDGEPTSTSGTKTDTCVELPKLDDDNLAEYTDPTRHDPDELRSGDVITFPEEGVEITLTNVYLKDGDDEAYGFDWESNKGLCRIEVGAAGDTLTYDYEECATSGTEVIAPETPSPEPQQAAISNLTFWYCADEKPNGDPVCVPNSTTQYLGFEWCLPKGVGNEVQGESIDFDLKFYTEQCRHNENPTNPFAK
ncbi:SipW-dependent-type signal peptide-containing protein [Halovivax gelatinilyticus]|uniref:SipW-dependent-type signal peptide-containing protein n=1 Tax=Halovivax gelatinilyticus TaxID=2961597 RepID=UPI0020CA2F27|nr:SipW-dependent-type signal peptide-containing protein [Halovivax gelatinilyticus]